MGLALGFTAEWVIDQWLQAPHPEGWRVPGGWVECGSCPNVYNPPNAVHQGGCSLTCPVGQIGYSKSDATMGLVPDEAWNTYVVGYSSLPDSTGFQAQKAFQRVGDFAPHPTWWPVERPGIIGPGDFPGQVAEPAPRPAPVPFTPGNPITQPPGQPEAPFYPPTPNRRPRVYPLPTPWPEGEPQPEAEPVPEPGPGAPLPGVPPIVVVPPTVPGGPGQPDLPVQPPDWHLEPGPGGAPTWIPVSRTAPPRRRPPRRREKEAKVMITTVFPRTWAALNFGTEAIEFIGVVWNGIPRERRTYAQYAGYPQMLRDIYNNAHLIDWAQVLTAYFNNQFEDFAYGVLGRQAAGLNRLTGSVTGGPSAYRQVTGSLGEVVNNETGESIVMNPLPTLVLDPETGQLTLTWQLAGWESVPVDTRYLATGSGALFPGG